MFNYCFKGIATRCHSTCIFTLKNFRNLLQNVIYLQEDGRLQILNIHTRKMKTNGKLSEDVDLGEFAQLTKVKDPFRAPPGGER